MGSAKITKQSTERVRLGSGDGEEDGDDEEATTAGISTSFEQQADSTTIFKKRNYSTVVVRI